MSTSLNVKTVLALIMLLSASHSGAQEDAPVRANGGEFCRKRDVASGLDLSW